MTASASSSKFYRGCGVLNLSGLLCLVGLSLPAVASAETLLKLLRPGTETKPAQIEPILQRYPGRSFILIGDSGERDPEVYGDIARRFSSQVVRVLIRNVDGSSAGDPRYLSAFTGVAADKWQLFDHPGQITTSDFLQDSE